MWACHLCLGYNIWFDEGYKITFTEDDKQKRDFLYFDEDVFVEICDFLSEQGINTVILEVAEGIIYDYAPELAVKGSLTKVKMRKLIEYMRSRGLTPIPKLDFSAAHDTWLGEYSRMLSTDEYRELGAKLICEMCELFGKPEYFHLGFADETVEAQKYYQYVIVRGAENFWRDLNFFADACRKMSARPIISGEQYYRQPEIFEQRISDDIVIEANFTEYMNPLKDKYGRDLRSDAQKKFECLIRLKNDIIYSGNGITAFNMDSLCEYAAKQNLPNFIGMMTSSGEPTTRRVANFIKHDAFRLANGKRFFE